MYFMPECLVALFEKAIQTDQAYKESPAKDAGRPKAVVLQRGRPTSVRRC